MQTVNLFKLFSQMRDAAFEIYYSDATFFYSANNEKSSLVCVEDPALLRRLVFYCNYCLKTKSNTSFSIINWENSSYKSVCFRKVEFNIQENHILVRFQNEKTTTPQSIALLQNISIIENISDPVLITEAEPFSLPGPRIIYVNKAFEEMSGYTLQELFGKTPHILQGEKTSNDLKILMRNAFKEWKSIVIELINYKKSNEEFLVELSITPVADETGWWTHWFAIERDITQKKLIQHLNNQNEKLASLGVMAAGVAHEINNPLTIITSSLSSLNKLKENPEKFAIKIESIKRAAFRIDKIVKGLSKFSRSSVGTPHMSEALETIVAEVLILIDSKAKYHSISLTLSTEKNLNIFCDPIEIEQVIINLVNNAIDAASSQTDKWIKINCYAESEHVVLQVMDSGSAISESVELKMLQPFFTTKPIGAGTGLGLSISKGILDNHNAVIKLNRNYPNTCLEIRFPKLKAIKSKA